MSIALEDLRSTEGNESFLEVNLVNFFPPIELGSSFLYGGVSAAIAIYFSNSNLEV